MNSIKNFCNRLLFNSHAGYDYLGWLQNAQAVLTSFAPPTTFNRIGEMRINARANG